MKPGSKQWKNFMAKLYGWGAAIVIIGALFKIQHWEGASLMLILGLGTEAFITTYSYNNKLQVQAVTNTNRKTTTYEYDDFGLSLIHI